MTVALQQLVKTRVGPSSFGDRKAVIELHDDGRFVLFRIDKKTSERTETLLDVQAATLRVGGSQSVLMLKSAGRTHRIDFTNPNSLTGFAVGGLIGMAVADSIGNSSGIKTWVEALRARGATIRYSSLSTSFKVIMITFGALMLSLVLLVGAIQLFG